MAAAGAPAARCLTVPLTLALLLGQPGQALGLQRAGAAAVNPPTNEELSSSLLVNQLVLLQLMQDASNAGNGLAERETRREKAAAAHDASLQELVKVVQDLENANQETLKAVKGLSAQHVALRQEMTSKVTSLQEEMTSGITSLREEMAAQGRLLEKVHFVVACRDGWFCHESSRYLVDDTDRTWEASLEYCRGLGGDLAKITSEEEQEFIKSHLDTNREYWIGLNDRATEDNFVWTDGSTATYTKWYEGQPNDAHNSEDCVIMHRGNLWADRSCSHKYKVVCERPLRA